MYSSIASAESVNDRKYGQLLQSVQPRKIESKKDYERFVSLLESLLEQEEDSEISQQEGLLIELLAVLIQDYERQHTQWPSPKPLDILIHLMEAKDIKQSDLVGIVGSSGVVSEVINGKREISKAQAHSLGKLFNMSYKLFL